MTSQRDYTCDYCGKDIKINQHLNKVPQHNDPNTGKGCIGSASSPNLTHGLIRTLGNTMAFDHAGRDNSHYTHYRVNQPGARTLRDAKPLEIEGGKVTAELFDDTRLYIYVGLELAFEGDRPENTTDEAKLIDFIVKTAQAWPSAKAEQAKAATELEALEAAWARIEASCSEEHSDRWHAMMGGSENADATMEGNGYGYGQQHGTPYRAEWLECAIAGAEANLAEIETVEVFSYPAPDGVTITVEEDGSELLVTVTVPAKVVLKHLGQRAANAARAYVKSVGEASPVTRTGHSVGLAADKRSDVLKYWYSF